MTTLRKTTQYMLPVIKPHIDKCQYDIYPTFELEPDCIHSDFASLAKALCGFGNIVIDGYVGVRFDIFRATLTSEFEKLSVRPLWWDISAAMKHEAEIDKMIAPFLGDDDPIFGRRTTLTMEDFYDRAKVAKIEPDPLAQINIICGEGASLVNWSNATIVYLDIPKNEIQFRSRAESIVNLGASKCDSAKKMYKRFYFVDWIVCNRHKKSILPRIDFMVDAQREDEITWTTGEVIRNGLQDLSENAFRVRPWFEPGAWGGQWIKNHIHGLARDVPNYAWSFELIVPENGIIFSSGGNMLEISFDSLMYQSALQVVGKECYALYKDEFPIRMDYLDNFDGGNLSIQCHPQREYAQRNFGEVLTQEETYYMLDCKDDALVYLGFKEDVVPDQYEAALNESFEKSTPLDIERFINCEIANKHDFFLMPPGTLHSSGRNNLVLEISTTPYIFTFKMYDWLTLDLDGKPRPLNIKRAMDNLVFERKGEAVKRELVSRPILLENGSDWQLWHLPTHKEHSYDVHRFTIGSQVDVETEDKCHVLNLVEGQRAEVHTAAGRVYPLNYAETLIVSAAAGAYKIINKDNKPIMMVKAFMK